MWQAYGTNFSALSPLPCNALAADVTLQYTRRFFCISCSWEHQRKVWSTKQLQLCYLLATLSQEGEQVLQMKWQNMQSKIQKKEVFWTNLLYQFGQGGGKGERTKENELKQEEKAQYLYHLDLVIQPNRINRRIMSFRVGFWEVKWFQVLVLNCLVEKLILPPTDAQQAMGDRLLTWLPKFTEYEYCSHPSHPMRQEGKDMNSRVTFCKA